MKKYLIYELRDFTTGNFYIGHTSKTLAKRLKNHIYTSKIEKSNLTSKQIILNKNYDIFLLEIYISTKEDVLIREGLWIRLMKPYGCVNFRMEARTPQEYRAENKNKISENLKKYYNEHTEERINFQKNYYREHAEQYKIFRNTDIECECGAVVKKPNIARHRKSKKHLNFVSPYNV